MRILARLVDLILKVAIGACIAGIMLSVGFQVIARGTVGAFSWPEELSVILMIWGLMLGSVYVLSERGHVGISYFTSKLNYGQAALLSVLINGLIIAFAVAVIYGSVNRISSLWNLKTGALGISRAVPNLALPVACLFYIIIAMRLALEDVITWRRSL